MRRSFPYNIRFPGQYFMAETGLNYNYFRDYDPLTGKYVESDPIGMKGGSYSPYVYVGSQPLRYVDRFGLRNGCGSEGSWFKPPDFPLGYEFFDCCNRHDDCYDDCKNSPTKDQCDHAFQNCLS